MSKSGVLSYLQYEPLWRGDLSPLGCEATPNPDTSVYQTD
ncbi:protein of unknown function [Pseudomonas mediterranea]